jgi:hypothetical protein
LIRSGFYPTGGHGADTQRAFLGLLCDDCLSRASQEGSPENRWIVKQVRLVWLVYSELQSGADTEIETFSMRDRARAFIHRKWPDAKIDSLAAAGPLWWTSGLTTIALIERLLDVPSEELL